MIAAAVLVLAATATASPAPSPPAPVALVGGEPITEAELESRAAPRTIEARTHEYEERRRALEELIAERLVAREAARRGIDVPTLLRTEVDEKAVRPTAHDARRLVESRPKDFEAMSDEEALRAAHLRLTEERRAQRRAGLVAMLRTRAAVSVLLEPPRVEVEATGAARGPADAPVTIVEFSDFQCPFCRRATPTLRAVEKAYAGKVRRVFRHWPLDRHADAPRAAEAAECAGEQGRFWEMHEALFAEERLSAEAITGAARRIGLDLAAFGSCLASRRHEARWRRDKAAAEAYATGGTPLFFVNGRLVAGAQPFSVFARVIDEELAGARK